MRRQIPTGNSPVDKINPRRENELVIRHRCTTGQCHCFRIAVHANSPIMHDVHTAGGHCAVRMSEIINGFDPTEIKVRKEAGVIHARRFDQGDVNRAFAVFGDVARRGRTAGPAANNHNPRLSMAAGEGHGRCQSGCRCGTTAHKYTSIQFHVFSSQSFACYSRSLKYAASAAISSSDRRPAIICMTGCDLIFCL